MTDTLPIDEIAALFHVTPQSVHNWIAAGLPVVERGRRGRGSRKTQLSLRAAVDWYFGENAEHLEADRQRARRDKESADKLALQNAETRGDLARVSVMESELGMVLADHRSNALGLPSKLAPKLVGLNADQIKDIIEGAVYELLCALADYRPGRKRQK